MKKRPGYTVGTRRERLEWVVLPWVCATVGHRPEQKMYATICRRCRVVLGL